MRLHALLGVWQVDSKCPAVMAGQTELKLGSLR